MLILVSYWNGRIGDIRLESTIGRSRAPEDDTGETIGEVCPWLGLRSVVHTHFRARIYIDILRIRIEKTDWGRV